MQEIRPPCFSPEKLPANKWYVAFNKPVDLLLTSHLRTYFRANLHILVLEMNLVLVFVFVLLKRLIHFDLAHFLCTTDRLFLTITEVTFLFCFFFFRIFVNMDDNIIEHYTNQSAFLIEMSEVAGGQFQVTLIEVWEPASNQLASSIEGCNKSQLPVWTTSRSTA